ncbi:MAG: ribonuclease H family protein [Bacteroidia bacterium]|nr:ribonuclease H family protein [Bacteroidia bacterium]
MAKRKKKYYVVWIGVKPGIYESWDECRAQITAFPGAKYKSFKTKQEAESAFRKSPADVIQRKTKSKSKAADLTKANILWNSLSVDAACSGNPGIMEYRGVHTKTREEIFRKGPYYDATNNVGEFLALVHGLALLKKNDKPDTIIYTDSRTALSWIRNMKVKTTLKRNDKNDEVFVMIDKALKWLKNNPITNPIIKWDTKSWGEIPADFGRK